MTALAGVELESLVSEPDALTTRPPPCASLNKLVNSIFKILVCPTMRRNYNLFSRKNFNLIKNLKGNRQMQYAKQQIFLSQIQHLNIFARVNKKNGPY